MTAKYQTCELEIELADFGPPAIRRFIDVDAGITLRQLHHIIQIAFGWESRHMYQFITEGDLYTDPKWIEQPSTHWRQHDDRKATLSDIARTGFEFLYAYDFGDDWKHMITVKSITPTDTPLRHAILRKAEMAGPVEDCGGAYGWTGLVSIVANDDDSLEAMRAMSWAEEFGKLNPGYCDERAINAAFVRLAQNGGGRT